VSSATEYRGSRDASGTAYDEASRGAGWLVFASCMLGLVGTWNIIEGMLAVGRSHVYGVFNTYVFSDVRTWGWIMIGVGVLELAAAFAVVTGSNIARWFGIGVAGINAIAQLSFVPSYPWWSIMMFAVDVLVIYGLAAYGGRPVEA
jgi:hypothetical protein